MFYLYRGAYAAFDRCEALSFEIAQFGDVVCPTGQQLRTSGIRHLRKTPYFDPVRNSRLRFARMR
jgi:hypothetical protein